MNVCARMIADAEWTDCYPCNGTGIDDSDFTGRCPFCGGSGQVLSMPDVDDSEDEDG